MSSDAPRFVIIPGARRIGYADDLGHGSHIMAQSNAPMLSPPTRQAPLWSVGSRDVAAAGRAANDIGGASKRSTAVQRTLEPCLTPAPCSSLPPRPMLQNSQNMIPCPHRSSRRDIAAPDGHDMRENCSNSRPMNVKQTHGVNTPPARSNDEQGYTADAADRVDRAERRAEEAEEARQVAEAATAAAESEAQRAHDQTQCLRFEAEEMARWRDALLQVRETLESAEHARHTECHNAIAELHKNGAELGRNEGERSSRRREGCINIIITTILKMRIIILDRLWVIIAPFKVLPAAATTLPILYSSLPLDDSSLGVTGARSAGSEVL